MAVHHIIPRFFLKRWTNARGRLEVANRLDLKVGEEDPARFYALNDFNRMENSDGQDDPWLEHEFLGTLDSDVARFMGELENVPRPPSLIKLKKHRDWHPIHLMSPRKSVRMAMYVGAQAVRSPVWREAVSADTAVDIKRTLEEKVQRDLALASDPAEIERLEKMLGLRYLVRMEGNTVPHLSGHLSFRLGQVLYERCAWTIWHFSEPTLALGADPVLLLGDGPQSTGSFSQVATRSGHKLSLWRDLGQAADDAVEILAQAKFVILPIDPTRALVLAQFRGQLPPLPGRYDQPRKMAALLNGLMSLASPDWLIMPPGHMDEARRQLHDRYPWLARQEARRSERQAPGKPTQRERDRPSS